MRRKQEKQKAPKNKTSIAEKTQEPPSGVNRMENMDENNVTNSTNLFSADTHVMNLISRNEALTTLMYRKWTVCAGNFKDFVPLAKRAVEQEEILASREIEGMIEVLIKKFNTSVTNT